MTRTHGFTAIALFAALLPLSACQSVQRFVPRDETPVLPPAFAVEVPRGPSNQRLGRDGYPLLGAVPYADGPQASPQAVAETQARYGNVAGRARAVQPGYDRTVADLQRTTAARNERNSAYRQSVEELRALAEAQQAGTR